MELMINILIFILGMGLLVLASDWLIQVSVKLSFLIKLTPLFIGVGIIGFGTSLPEAGVGITAAIVGAKAIALGNIIGSCIANIGLILGLCAMIVPQKVDKAIFKRELPIMVFAVVLLYLVSLDGFISRPDGMILLICFIGFLVIVYRGAKKSFNAKEAGHFILRKPIKNITSPFTLILLVISFLGLLLGGAFLMVKGGTNLARAFGVSPWVIAITVFAIGTSLPELAASLSASFKKMHNISVGNIIGSNIFNIFFALGVIALIRPLSIKPSLLRFEFPVMLAFSFFLFTTMRTGYKITRKEGMTLFAGYVLFLTVLILKQ